MSAAGQDATREELERVLVDQPAVAGGLAFDTLAGLAFRRWCPPLLDLPAHTSVPDYEERRSALGQHLGERADEAAQHLAVGGFADADVETHRRFDGASSFGDRRGVIS